MGNDAIIVWLLAQAGIEILLCASLLYLICGRKGSKEEVVLEAEKLKKLVLSCDRVVHKHHALSDLWEKVEKRKAALEACMDGPSRRPKTGGRADGAGHQIPGSFGISAYEKTARLLKQGVPVGEIIKQVGLPRGEVELIMNLRSH